MLLLSALTLLSSALAVDLPASALKEYAISAPGIRARFIPYGARMTSLEVPDRGDVWRDVNLGYDEPQGYAEEKAPTFFGTVVGRYANRIRNGTFVVDGQSFSVPLNDHDGKNTLHGGNAGYDAREWQLVSHNASSVVFSLMDYGFEGFPGNVLALASYTATPGKLTVVLTGHALDAATPIMLTTHCFFNLGSTLSPLILDDTVQLPGASRFVGVDGIAVPTGELVSVAEWRADGSLHPLNYTSPRRVSDSLPAEFCGDGCSSFDNCFVYDDYAYGKVSQVPQVVMHSDTTGIRMQVSTNQPAVQLYACVGSDGSVTSQLGRTDKFGCMAIEPQGFIDGINHPEWNQNQIYSPATGPFVNVAEYAFDTVPIAEDPELAAALGIGHGYLRN